MPQTQFNSVSSAEQYPLFSSDDGVNAGRVSANHRWQAADMIASLEQQVDQLPTSRNQMSLFEADEPKLTAAHVAASQQRPAYQQTALSQTRPYRDSTAWLEQQLVMIPQRFAAYVKQEWQRRAYSLTAKDPLRSANIWARQQIDFVQGVLKQYPVFTKASQLRNEAVADRLALNLATRAFEIFTHCAHSELTGYAENIEAAHQALAAFCRTKGIRHPQLPDLLEVGEELFIAKGECQIQKMICEDWWARRIREARDLCNEHLQIVCGNVGNGSGRSPYASKEAVRQFRSRRRAQNDWINGQELVSEDDEVISLRDAVNASVSNPELRRIDLMVRARGLQELAEEDGMVGFMATFTLPSKYHRMRAQGTKLNNKYNGASPKDGQRALNGVWAKIRAKLKRDEIEYRYFRGVEPHVDGTPHWHILFFCHRENATALRDICREYVSAEDATDRGVENRFDWKAIDPTKGSAVGYVAKYIAKNVSLSEVDNLIDDDTGRPANEVVINVRTWATRNRIRQFSFGGLVMTAGLYRETRRIAADANGLDRVGLVRAAACSGDWKAFVKTALAIGLKGLKEDNGCNKYGEAQTKMVGVQIGTEYPINIRTRSKVWAFRAAGAASKGSDSCRSRSTNNKCTEYDSEGRPRLVNHDIGHRVIDRPMAKPTDPLAAFASAVRIPLHQLDDLRHGNTVMGFDGTRWRLEDGQVRELGTL
ncbi:replication endonuclease [Ferrimonas senticii]|uniref:replication endonuclease n=1 Tax=Ferrimonas senticii TaxID=394566 RepID=UPI0003FC3B3E|nr:replication endonuclease [Ferrimonas senticii]